MLLQNVLFLLLILLQASEQAFGWCQQTSPRPPHHHRHQRKNPADKLQNSNLKATPDNYIISSVTCRRSFLFATLIASASSMSIPALAFASDSSNDTGTNKPPIASSTSAFQRITTTRSNIDALESFGLEIQNAKWPNTPSPLPKPAQKSSSEPESKSNLPMSDLQKALEQAKRQKNVGPLTHG
jgi:hypothetical protein